MTRDLVMKLGVAILLLALGVPFMAQSKPAGSENAMKTSCLVRLAAPDEHFPDSLKGSGWIPAAHSTSLTNWLLEGPGDCASAGRLSSVRSAEPAARLIVILDQGAATPRSAIEDLGGIVVSKLQNASVVTVVMPASSAVRVKSIPGVSSVRKDLPASTTGSADQKR